jgi:hypothetical protein
MYLDHIYRIYTATLPSPSGYTASAIDAVEQQFGIHFPAAYREFLQTMGRGFEPWAGSDSGLGILADLQQWARDLLDEDGFALPLPDDALVFCQHGGNDFDFFLLSEGDDPPTYFYDTDQDLPVFQRSAEHFSTYVMNSLVRCLEIRRIPLPAAANDDRHGA